MLYINAGEKINAVSHTHHLLSVCFFFKIRNILGTAIDLYLVSLLIGLPNTCMQKTNLRKRFNLLIFAQRKMHYSRKTQMARDDIGTHPTGVTWSEINPLIFTKKWKHFC